MSITSGFFNSVDGDRLYNAREMSMYFKGLISDGVYESVGGKLKVTAGTGMTVNVADGRAMIDCQWFNSDAIETLQIDAADVGKKRKDAIALRLDLNESARNITLYVKKGTATAGTPALPARTWTASVKELYLGYVTISATTTAITTSMITDLRGTSSCPYVTGIVEQVDAADLFEQYQASCEEFYAEMTKQFNDYFTARKNEFDEFLSTLTSELKIDTSIAKYQSYNVYKSETGYIESISMPLAEYESGDVVFIHIGGVLLVEGVEYTIGGGVGTGATISFPNRLKDNGAGVPITVIILKNDSIGSISAGSAGALALTFDGGTESIAAGETKEV